MIKLMQIKNSIICLIFVFLQLACKAQVYEPSDKAATLETRWLYGSLQRLIGAGVIFGHQDDLAYGVGWRGDKGRSDVKSVTGSYPALYGWDLARMELGNDKDINNIPFAQQRALVKQVYQRGGINTFCWHLNNPVNGRSAWDTSQNTVREIIPGGAHHQAYVKYLDRIARYLKSLKGEDGEPIPILFRPFHELTGNWFWWGKNTCSPEDFKSLWCFTIEYLRQKKKLHNLLIVYSVADFKTTGDFMERYPGDIYVDVLGFDSYCYKSVADFQKNLEQQISITQNIALHHHKLFTIAETGYELLPQNDWWTKVLLPVISRYKLSYLMVWRNGRPDHFYAPYPGQASAADFKTFFTSGQTMFQNTITGLSIYGKYMLPNPM
jgi:mannan endo-1,4-beta-mannosidase